MPHLEGLLEVTVEKEKGRKAGENLWFFLWDPGSRGELSNGLDQGLAWSLHSLGGLLHSQIAGKP